MAQRGRCPLCGDLLLHADHEPQTPHEWEQWIKVTRKAIRKQAITADAGPGTPDEPVALRLTHASCRYRPTADTGNSPALLPAREPSGLARAVCG
jgi:RNA-directed DNA polymerase